VDLRLPVMGQITMAKVIMTINLLITAVHQDQPEGIQHIQFVHRRIMDHLLHRQVVAQMGVTIPIAATLLMKMLYRAGGKKANPSKLHPFQRFMGLRTGR